MYLRHNPVLSRELTLYLRTPRAFMWLVLFIAGVGGIILAVWPAGQRIDLTTSSEGRSLIEFLLLGEFLIGSVMAPALAAGSITGERERQSFEMLVASPLRPGAIVIGKWLASLGYLALLMIASVPIALLCVPLGGISFYELAAMYVVSLFALATDTAISVACSSYFRRTLASVVVSYLIILPLSLGCLLSWYFFSHGDATVRLIASTMIILSGSVVLCPVLLGYAAFRLREPDVGGESQTKVDDQQEQARAVGLVLNRQQFPDRLFAPPKRTELLPDGSNPVLDKELRSELFSQGSLMLRLVIQISMLLALPMMIFCLYVFRQHVPFYPAYVAVFNFLAAPVFLAGSITNERERETLDLLLVTTLSPGQIVWGKLLAGLRVSSVLTSFLLWPLVLAFALDEFYWINWATMLGYLALVAVVCLTTPLVAMLCSVVCHKTTNSLLCSYVLLVLLWGLPPAVQHFAATFFPEALSLARLDALSPIATMFTLPLKGDQLEMHPGNWTTWRNCLLWHAVLIAGLWLTIRWRFHRRWRIVQ